MTAEMKKEFEHEFTHLNNLGGIRSMATVNADRVFNWFESKLKSEIAEACKKQRLICSRAYLDEKGYEVTNSIMATVILNAPSPLDEVK